MIQIFFIHQRIVPAMVAVVLAMLVSGMDVGSSASAQDDLATSIGRDEKSANVDFGRDVFSVLKKSCFECHGDSNSQAWLGLCWAG